MIACEMPARIT